LFEFYWRVPESGFEWVRATPYQPKHAGEQEEEYLVAVGDSGRFDTRSPEGPLKYRAYEPLKHSALFKVFASTDPTPAGALSFANKYGALGGPTSRAVKRSAATDPVNGQPLWFWRREILGMKHAVDVWEAVKRGDSKFLARYVRWHEPGEASRPGFTYTGPPNDWNMTLTPPSSMPEIDAMLVPGDPILPARVANREFINFRLMASGGLIPKLSWGRVRGKPCEMVRFVPGDLISALWLQLARAIEGDLKYDQCDECKEWFQISGDRRADARFCSDACRFRAYRKRQKEARRLHAAGLSTRDIARQLGSEVKVVKRWIAGV
jgi:hypothetical protein